MSWRYIRKSLSKKERNVIAGFLALLILGLVNFYRKDPQGFFSFFGYCFLAVIGFFIIRNFIVHRRKDPQVISNKILGQNFDAFTLAMPNVDPKVKYGQTKYSRLLYGALARRGIESKTEYYDGHKSVDLAIPSARIYIEVDGIQHLNDPSQIIRDFKRDYYSEREGFYTLRISNENLKTHLNSIADAIAEVVRENTTKK